MLLPEKVFRQLPGDLEMATRMQFSRNGTKLRWTLDAKNFVECDTAKISDPTTRETAFYHGVKQKVSDGAAIEKDTETGKPATNAEKKAAMQKIVENLYAGQWVMRASGDSDETLTFEAAVRMKMAEDGIGRESAEVIVTPWIKGLDRAGQAAFRASKRGKKWVDEVRAERAPTMDAEEEAELFAGLDAVA
jgi:hypothetical protein